jgi:hypothetical protein
MNIVAFVLFLYVSRLNCTIIKSAKALSGKMKRSKNLFCLVLFFALTLYSCSNENDNNVKLLRKIIETSEAGLSESTLFTYNGNEIVNIDRALKSTDFKYKDGLITRIVVLNKATKALDTINYSYVEGKLVLVESVGNYTTKYIHNPDNTISYEQFSINGNDQKVKEHHGLLIFKNGNLTNDKRISDNLEAGHVMKNNRTYSYDKKINPFTAILGFNKLLGPDEIMSTNNSFSIVFEDSATNKNKQVTSNAGMSSSNFKYDADGYPIVKFSETTLLPNGNKGYMKTEYFY